LHHYGGNDDKGERRRLEELFESNRWDLEMGELPRYLSKNRDAVALKSKPIDRNGRRHDAEKRARNAPVDPFRAHRHGEDSEPEKERNAVRVAKFASDHGGSMQQAAIRSFYPKQRRELGNNDMTGDAGQEPYCYGLRHKVGDPSEPEEPAAE
jgi:hypothetical protein